MKTVIPEAEEENRVRVSERERTNIRGFNQMSAFD